MAVDQIERRDESTPAGRAAARGPFGRACVLDEKTLTLRGDHLDRTTTDERTGRVRTGTAPSALE